MTMLKIMAACGAALALSGCVVLTPVPQQPGAPVPTVPGTTTPAPAPAPTTPAPTVLDSASRALARQVVNTEMQKRLPGTDVTPYTDCIINNATTAELIDIAQMSRAGVAGVADSVAVIVKRPATGKCIASAVQGS